MSSLYTIQIRNSASKVLEIVCTFDSLAEITHILDKSDPHKVFEYKISSVSCVYSQNELPFFCEKLVTEFDWNKEYVPPKFEFMENKK